MVPLEAKPVALLLALGSVTQVISQARYSQKTAKMFLFSGLLLFSQFVAIGFYRHFTSINHQVPDLIATAQRSLLSLAGYNVSSGDGTLHIFVMRQILSFSSSWEYFLGPAAFAFLAGALAKLVVDGTERDSKVNTKRLARNIGLLLLAALVWMFLKTSLLTTVIAYQAWTTDYDDALNLMDLFFSNWVRVAALLPLAWICHQIFRGSHRQPSVEQEQNAHGKVAVAPVAALCVGIVALTLAIHLDPVGNEKKGRVWIDEFHSDWEPTTREYNTEWFGEKSTYNYYAIYEYLSHYFKMERLTEEVTLEKLEHCDVLILKVPTIPYTDAEQAAITQYVQDGGSVLMLGEHTDFLRSSSYLNTVARRFGFEFQEDALLHIDTGFTQRYQRPFAAHPVLNFVNEVNFAVSSSISATDLLDRRVVQAGALRALKADYHMANFYPKVEDYTDVDYGIFTQLMAKRFGKGRIVAFADSTIFSNFCAFEPGKSELMIGMIAWLNRSGNGSYVRAIFLSIAIMMALLIVFRHRSLLKCKSFVTVLLLASWALGVSVTNTYHAHGMPFPQQSKDYVDISIDRSLSRVPLSQAGFVDGHEYGYGIFEQWLLRLGYFTRRRSNEERFDSDLIVFFNPQERVSQDLVRKTRDYLNMGGKILVIDSVHNQGSTANQLLEEFGIRILPQQVVSGAIKAGSGTWPVIEVDSSLVVEGPTNLLTCKGRPILSYATLGKGEIYVVGFGADFADARMGMSMDVVPDEELRQRYELQFALSRHIVGGAE
jgi:hypothetical protein